MFTRVGRTASGMELTDKGVEVRMSDLDWDHKLKPVTPNIVHKVPEPMWWLTRVHAFR